MLRLMSSLQSEFRSELVVFLGQLKEAAGDEPGSSTRLLTADKMLRGLAWYRPEPRPDYSPYMRALISLDGLSKPPVNWQAATPDEHDDLHKRILTEAQAASIDLVSVLS